MLDGDPEDLWLACFDNALWLHGFVEGATPTTKQIDAADPAKIIDVANLIYDAVKGKTGPDMARRPKPVPQLKSV